MSEFYPFREIESSTRTAISTDVVYARETAIMAACITAASAHFVAAIEAGGSEGPHGRNLAEAARSIYLEVMAQPFGGAR